MLSGATLDRGSPEQCKGADKWLVPITTNHLSLTINHLLNMLEKNEMISVYALLLKPYKPEER